MKMQPGNRLLQKRLRAEIQRILQLLERTRRTRRQVRWLVALETRTSRRRTGIGSRELRSGR
jgi:hypothetical protein